VRFNLPRFRSREEACAIAHSHRDSASTSGAAIAVELPNSQADCRPFFHYGGALSNHPGGRHSPMLDGLGWSGAGAAPSPNDVRGRNRRDSRGAQAGGCGRTRGPCTYRPSTDCASRRSAWRELGRSSFRRLASKFRRGAGDIGRFRAYTRSGGLAPQYSTRQRCTAAPFRLFGLASIRSASLCFPSMGIHQATRIVLTGWGAK
jgi:hypothetical protein